MKKIIHGLLAAASVMSPIMLSADVANKTFIADRGTLSSNCLIGLGSGAKDCKKDGLGADITVAGFFRQSHNHTKLARYFGGGTTAADQNGTIEVDNTAAGETQSLHGWQVDYTTTQTQAAHGTITLNPRRTEVGAQVQWNQCLNKLVKGLWFSVAAPVVYVRTEMRATYDQTANATDNATTKGQGNNLSDIFEGGAAGKTSPFTQNVLTHQKLTSTYNHETGVADVSAVLGYKFVEEANYSFSGSVHANIPTGNKPAGVVAFEPIYGSRNFSFGAGLHGNFNLWRSEDKKSELNMHACGKYSYGFGAEQVRTLGLSSNTDGVVAQGHRILAAKSATAILTPLANLSTLAVTVEPKSRLEAVAGFCYRFNRISVDVAYNLFYNQAENVKVKALWDETSYGLPMTGLSNETLEFTDAADIIGGGAGSTGAILAPGNTANSYTVDLSAATTPAQLVHKVGGGVNYKFETKLPINIGVGADVEVSSNNQSLNSYSVWAKLGFSF
jgi:hypothetical protein